MSGWSTGIKVRISRIASKLSTGGEIHSAPIELVTNEATLLHVGALFAEPSCHVNIITSSSACHREPVRYEVPVFSHHVENSMCHDTSVIDLQEPDPPDAKPSKVLALLDFALSKLQIPNISAIDLLICPGSTPSACANQCS